MNKPPADRKPVTIMIASPPTRSFAALLSLIALSWSCGSDQHGQPGGPVETAAGGGGSGPDGGGGSQATGGQGGSEVVFNEGFIGGPCDADADCDYEGGFCLPQEDGFPGGFCSLDCDQFCPDEEGMVTTFCTEPKQMGTSASEGLCTTRCDYGLSPSGCRTGYQCKLLSRYQEADVEVYACVPGDDDPFVLGECHQELLARGVAFSPAVNPLDSPEGQPNLVCDIIDPVWLQPVLAGVAFRPSSLDNDPKTMFTACPHALAMLNSAEVLAEAGVSDLVHYGIYNCRVIANTTTISQHGLANALDIAGLKLAGGGYYSVLSDWEKAQPNPKTEGGKLLHSFGQAVYDQQIYNIILSPDYNDAHADHLHCDLTPGSHYFK